MIVPFYREIGTPSAYNRQLLTINDFSGGLNNVDTDIMIADNQLLDCKNVKFDDNYTIEKRPGYVTDYKWTTQQPGDGQEQFPPGSVIWLDTYYRSDGAKHSIKATNKGGEYTIYIDDVEYGTKELSDISHVEGINFNDCYYLVDGNYMYKIFMEEEATVPKMVRMINDPKLFINSIYKTSAGVRVPGLSDYVKIDTTANPKFAKEEYMLAGEMDEPYSATADYFADGFGLYKLENLPVTPEGEDPAEPNIGEVNETNYKMYYVKVIGAEQYREGVSIKGIVANIQREREDVNFYLNKDCYFNSPMLGTYVKSSIDNVENDYVFNVVYPVLTHTPAEHKYLITEATPVPKSENEYIFNMAGNADETYGYIWKDDIPDIWEQFLEKVVAGGGDPENINTASDLAAIEFLLQTIDDYVAHTVLRLYKPRDTTWVIGEEIEENGDLWYQPCEFDLSSTFLGENYLPNSPRSVAVFNSRLWTTGDTNMGNEIRGTQVSQSIYFPAAVSLGLSPNGDTVKDMFEFDGALVIGRGKDIYAVYGNSTMVVSDSLFRLQKLDTTVGLISNNCGTIINNFYLFLGSDGEFYKMSTPTTNVEYLMVKPLTLFVDIKKPPLNIEVPKIKYCSCVSLNNTIYWYINNKVLVYSYTKMSFTYWQDMDCTCLYTDGEELMFGGREGSRYTFVEGMFRDGAVLVVDAEGNSTYEEGKAISSNVKTKPYFAASATNFKFFEQIMLTVSRPYKDEKSGVTIVTMFDSYLPISQRRIRIDIPSQSLYDYAEFDEYNYVSTSYFQTKWYQINTRARTINVLFKNDIIDETFKIAGFTIVYTGRDLR